MSLSDFERCTPVEFGEICDAYRLKEARKEALKRWEVALMLQPFSKKPIDPKDLLYIPEIDGKKQNKDVSKEESDRRFKELMKMRDGR